MRIVFMASVLVIAGVALRCNRLEGKSFNPFIPGYEEKPTRTVFLKKHLREISGIGFISSEKLVAINDEAGKIFFVDPRNGDFESFSFGDKGDYEDVAQVGNEYYVLRSDGHLFRVDAGDYHLVKEYDGDFGKHMEFESLYYDAAIRKLVLICKHCGKDAQEVNAYLFDPAKEQFEGAAWFTIDWKDIRRLAKNSQIECRPSAAALNPANGKLYIISSIGKVLLECTREGKLEQVYALNPYHFQQPEGICFSPEGDLYISNESVQDKATILMFKFSGRRSQ